jgi:hypothetical protein
MPPKRAGEKRRRGSVVRAAGGDADDSRAPSDAVDMKEAAGGADLDTALTAAKEFASDDAKRACGLPVCARWLRLPSFGTP